jgi:uncharacterized protein VirK/YbjX
VQKSCLQSLGALLNNVQQTNKVLLNYPSIMIELKLFFLKKKLERKQRFKTKKEMLVKKGIKFYQNIA